MTRNQIEYWSLLENKRSNIARETETKRANLAREVETNRSNVARELETARSNRMNEQITSLRDLRNYLTTFMNLQEQARHQRASESLGKQQLAESQRSAYERERQSAINTAATVQQLDISRSQVAETMRSNQARESEQYRSNTANELLKSQSIMETQRSNVANESIRSNTNLITLANNQATIRLRERQLSEEQRSHLAQEQLSIVNTGANILNGTLNAYSRYAGRRTYGYK